MCKEKSIMVQIMLYIFNIGLGRALAAWSNFRVGFEGELDSH